ncbi:MAG TPA: prepilin-type N-terminal cleavage/methylation domain-containing protein [Nitrospirae bacterium]|nr:prepilin-type N-terminal cleavage/methylation domain-containing protein [Nitrospirota bacterium]
MIIHNNRGFTLLEALIAMVILTIGIVSVISMQATFAKGTVDRTVLNALIDSASSLLNRCQIDTGTPSSVTYTHEGRTITVTRTGSCNPNTDTCNAVSATATDSLTNKTFTISTMICNFN